MQGDGHLVHVVPGEEAIAECDVAHALGGRAWLEIDAALRIEVDESRTRKGAWRRKKERGKDGGGEKGQR